MNAPGAGTRVALLPAQVGPTIILILLAPIAPAIADFFGPDGTGAAQQVVTFPFLGLMCGSLLSGLAIRFLGLNRLALIASAAFILSGAIGLFAAALPFLLFGATLLGLGGAWMTSALSGVTSTLFEGAERARLVALQSAVGNLIAAGLGLAADGLAGSLGWRTPFGAFMVFGVAMLLLTLSFIPTLTRDAPTTSGRILPVLARTWPVCLCGCVVFAIATNQSTNLPFLLAEKGMTNVALRTLVTISTSIAGIFGSLAYAAVQGRLHDRAMIVVAGAAGALGWLLFAHWSSGLVPALVGAGIIGLGMGITTPMLFTSSMRAVPIEASGAAVGLLTAAVFLGSFISAPLFAPLRVWAGLSGMMTWVATATVGVALLAFVWPRSPMPEKPISS